MLAPLKDADTHPLDLVSVGNYLASSIASESSSSSEEA